MADTLKGQVAIVTGAGRGIGRAIAVALAGRGAFVAAAARTTAEVVETVRLIENDGGAAAVFQTDVTDRESIAALTEQVMNLHDRIDILVNNAGVLGPIGPLATVDWQAWQNNIEVNLFGVFHCCQAVLPAMIAQNSGRIINLSGGGATRPMPNFSAYSASKAAVVRLTETLAEELRESNIQVNAVAPGAVNTRMLDDVLVAGAAAGGELKAALQRQKDGGTRPELAAELVCFLASDAAAGLTGKLIAAPYDDWARWDSVTIAKLAAAPWLTLRRIDPYTLAPLVPGTMEGKIGAHLDD